MDKIYFISDIHLKFEKSDFETEKLTKLNIFLDMVEKDGKILVMNGDIFDFWFEWYHTVPKYHFNLFFRLRKLIDKGVEIRYVTGNHDFYLREYLTDEIGLKCFEDFTEFEFDNKKFYCGHGDGYAKSDKGYRVLKKVLRHPVSKFLFRTFIHPDLGIELAKMTSHSSRTYRKPDRKKWEPEYYEAAEKQFNKGIDYVLFGHLHLSSRVEREDKKTYINTGDFITLFTYAVYENGELKLENLK